MQVSYKFLYALLFTIFSFTLLHAIIIDFSPRENLSILPKSEVLIGKAHLSKEQAIRQLEPYDKSTINTGMSAQEIWVRFSLQSKEGSFKRIIYLSSPLLERVDIYTMNQKSKYILSKRYKYLKRDEKSPFPHFRVTVSPQKSHYLLHLQPLCMPVDFSIKVLPAVSFFKKSFNYIIENVALFGFILSLSLYSFLLYFFIKDKSYIYYSIYLLFLIWHQITYVGILQLFAPYKLVLFDSQVTNLKIGLMIMASILYAVHFLQVKKESIIYKLYLFYLLAAILVISIAATAGLSADIIVITALAYILFNFIAGVISYLEGIKEARLFILGFGIVALCYTVSILDSLGYISFMERQPNILLYATALEALILSIAFADRYLILQREKEQIDTLRLQEIHDRTKIVEEKVAQKTEKLDRALEAKEMLIKEVHHRVKNNLQIILSMLRMQSHNSRNREIKKPLKDLENRINAIAKSYEMLLVTEGIERIDMAKYIKALVADIAQAYNFKKHKIEIESNIDATLSLKKAVYIGLIINELITNAYEHGEVIKQISKISISFQRVEDHYELIVEDNCGGSIPTKREDFGLGLKFIDALVCQQLEGNYTIHNKRITIWLGL